MTVRMSTVSVKYLAENVTANSTPASITYDGQEERVDLYFTGTFDTCSITIQAAPLNEGSAEGFVDVSGATAITSAQTKSLLIARDTKLQAVISSVGASTDVTVFARYGKA